MSGDIREKVVGGLVVAALIGVIGYLYAGRESATSVSNGIRVSAGFNRVDGLVEGDGVYLSGVKIGSVEKMWLDKNFRAIVTFRIDDTVHLPKDSSAAIHTDGLFGTKFVVLEPGIGDKPLTSGDKLTFTQDAVVVSDLLDLIISEGKANRAKAQAEKATQPAEPPKIQ